MKIHLWSLGRDHEKYVEPGVKDFTKRISNYFSVSWKIIPLLKNAGLLSEADLKRKEAEAVLKLLSDQDYLIALDERGKMLTSPHLAGLLSQCANESRKNVIFLIGGAYGLDPSILKRANYILSLSALTFPHQLVRLILAEQVYRACTIMRNEKYHHL